MSDWVRPFGRWWDKWIARTRDHGPLIVYRFDCAMHGAIELSTRWGTLCVAWPALGLRTKRFPPYVYLSPNHTPWAATWGISGKGRWTPNERRMMRVRRALWGHGYDTRTLDPQILDAAIWAAEDRSDEALDALCRMVRERRDWT